MTRSLRLVAAVVLALVVGLLLPVTPAEAAFAGGTAARTLAVATTPASATSAGTTVDELSAGATTVTFTVVRRTAYGWTAESASSGPLTC